MDLGSQSMITNPQAGQTIRLDHLKQEAQIIPTPPAPAMPAVPGGAPSLTPPTAPLNVKDLGPQMIAGHPVLGKSYTFQPPKLPSAPGMPQAPSAPQAPGMPPAPSAPQAPGMPQAPSLPKAPSLPQAPSVPQLHTVEVWTSPQLQMPLASRVTTPTGSSTTVAQQVTPGEPPASQFQIPPNYKLVPPPQPSIPSLPKRPRLPKPPSVPQPPKPPSLPSVPKPPSLP